MARIAAVCGVAIGLCGGPVALAATTERLVVDRMTGLALGGTDPWIARSRENVSS